jgi:hypothetical protein
MGRSTRTGITRALAEIESMDTAEGAELRF